MFFRVIFAAIIGGALALCGGFVGHELLKLTGRHIQKPTDMAVVKETFGKQFPQPGIYTFPMPPLDMEKLPEVERKAVQEKFYGEYKAGPAAFIAVGPNGTDFDMMKVLGYELISNVIAAFLAALVVAMSRPNLGFIVRWFIVMLIAVFSWVSVNASYHIWYRFPLPWVQDELYCALIEWAIAGIVIAAIVKPKERQMGY